MVLKELIWENFYFGKCGGIERSDFEQFLVWRGSGGLKRIDFSQFLPWGGCSGLERIDFNSFYFGE